MKKILVFLCSVLIFVLLSAGVGITEESTICPLNKPIYMLEETEQIFVVKAYARRVRYECFECTNFKDNEYIGRKEPFESPTNFDYPKYDKFIQYANLECQWSGWAETKSI